MAIAPIPPPTHRVAGRTSRAAVMRRARGVGRTHRRSRLCTLALLFALLASGWNSSWVVGNASANDAATTAQVAGSALDVHADSRAHWADGYAWGNNPTAATYTPSASYSFNRTGRPIQITKIAGTTGRYKVKFARLSRFLGKSTVQVTGYGANNDFCKPADPKLARNVIEVRCFDANTGAPADALFSVLTTRNYTDHAFAYANKPTANSYAPRRSASWNPQGGIKVFRSGVGAYRVEFAGLAALTGTNGGNVQVSAVGSGKRLCKVSAWGGSPDLSVLVRCFSHTGTPADTAFNTLFLAPSERLAYAWASQPSTASYTPSPFYSFNPAGGAMTISRSGPGRYLVTWSGAGSELLDGGNVQVTSYGTSSTQCKVESWGSESASVRCFLANGTLSDDFFSVLLGS